MADINYIIGILLTAWVWAWLSTWQYFKAKDYKDLLATEEEKRGQSESEHLHTIWLLNTSEEDKALYESEVAEKNRHINDLNTEIERVKKEKQRLQTKNWQINKRKEELELRINDLKHRLNLRNLQVDDLNSECDSLDQTIVTLTEQMSNNQMDKVIESSKVSNKK